MRLLSRVLLLIAALLAALPGLAAAAEAKANAVFLVARHTMQDPNFRETVLLVTQPPRGPPWGVIINRPLDFRLADLFTDYPALKTAGSVLYYGGPVQREGLVIVVRATNPPPDATLFLRNVFYTGDVNYIDALLRQAEVGRDVRVYAGYAGWSRAQLQRELERGGWHILPADAETVFDMDPAAIWPELVERATTKHTGGVGAH